MAVPLEVNSSVIRCRSVCTEMSQVTVANGTSTAARNTMILARSPNRGFLLFMTRSPQACTADVQSVIGTHRSPSTRVK